MKKRMYFVGSLLLAIAAQVPITARTIDVRLGIADGAWATLAKSPITSGGAGTFSSNVKSGAIVFTPPQKVFDRLTVTVSHNITEQAVRIVAVGRDGKEYSPITLSTGGTGNLMQLTATFDVHGQRDLSSVQLQARPYQWVLFKNVKVQGAAGEEDIEGKLRSGV